MPSLYLIAGCNGAGKTTASKTVFPQLLNCKEFVNADSIAAGISSFNPDGVALEAAAEMYWYWEMVMADLKGLRQVYCWKN